MFFQLFHNLRGKLNDKPFKQLMYILLWCLILFGIFTYLFKHAENTSWEEAIWQAWQTFTTVGYGNQPAVTTAGRVVTMLISTLGIALLGAMFSASFDYKEYLKDKKRRGYMKNPFRAGYVIFNFPGVSITYNLIREWRIVEPKVGVCIVDSRIESLPDDIRDMAHVHFIKGGTLSKNTYQAANLTENKAVIIFPMDAQTSESDGATKTTVDLINKFVDTQTRIIHVLVDSKNSWMFEDTNSTQIRAELEVLALVQESQDRHSAEIVEKLLLNTEGANPQTLTPKFTIGWTWGDFNSSCFQVGKQLNIKCNPFALIKNGEPFTCPDLDTIIEEGDLISIIAYNDFDWVFFEEQMKIRKSK